MLQKTRLRYGPADGKTVFCHSSKVSIWSWTSPPNSRSVRKISETQVFDTHASTTLVNINSSSTALETGTHLLKTSDGTLLGGREYVSKGALILLPCCRISSSSAYTIYLGYWVPTYNKRPDQMHKVEDYWCQPCVPVCQPALTCKHEEPLLCWCLDSAHAREHHPGGQMPTFS